MDGEEGARGSLTNIEYYLGLGAQCAPCAHRQTQALQQSQYGEDQRNYFSQDWVTLWEDRVQRQDERASSAEQALVQLNLMQMAFPLLLGCQN